MDEATWLACADPEPMLELVLGKASDRKLRLFACACCRRIWHRRAVELPAGVPQWLKGTPMKNERLRKAVEAAERYADGKATAEELVAARAVALEAGRTPARDAAEAAARTWSAWSAASEAWWRAARAVAGARAYAGAELAEQANLLRDIFGNPFRPLAVEPAWRTPDVLRLAEAAYEERSLPSGELDNARLAVLADALEDAGCDCGELLDHLRSPGPHVRGCNALDAVLGKE
jgi:hypothetical protein